MSKRLRQEAERTKQLATEIQDEEDKVKVLKEKIFAPIVWKRLVSGIKIQDLKPNYFNEVIEVIEEHYLNTEILLRNTNLADDAVSKKSYLERIMFNLKNCTSIIALDEYNNDAIAGVLVLKAVHKNDLGRVFSRVQLIEGEAYQKCMTFLNTLSRKVDVHAKYNCEIYLRFYLLCIKPEYRRRGLGFQLMQTGLDIARSLDVRVIMGVFSSFQLQKLAKKIGMQVHYEVNYVDWLDKYHEMIFDDPGAGNYTCAIMAGEVPEIVIPSEPTQSQKEKEKHKLLEQGEKVQKVPRAEKAKIKEKNAAKGKK